MPERKQKVGFLVFDVEAIADGQLIAEVRYSGEALGPAEAILRYRAELIEQKGTDVIPTTFMLPISVAIAKVDPAYRLIDVTVLDPPLYRPHEIVKRFWQGWAHYGRPTFVSFNGRGYDMPVLELGAYRYGLSVPDWFRADGPSYQHARNRYNTSAHLDLMDLFSNFGASRIVGGLNLLANIIGKPGKTGIDGSKIQDMYDDGQVEQINEYCRCDVLDTYFVFLRSRVLLGELDLQAEQEIVADTKTWLEQHAETGTAYKHYLEHWGDWDPPWAV